jgi:hypothetical protein
MRSLRQDIALLASKLSKLQKVGDELAANSGHRNFGVARALSSHEAVID